MTSISIGYNKMGIGISSDSAGTVIDTGKVFSANKIFRISNKCPVGLAVYNNLVIGGMPIDLIAKLYRKKSYNKRYARLETYKQEFIKFMEKKGEINWNNNDIIYDFLVKITDEIEYKYKRLKADSEKKLKEEILVDISIDEVLSDFKKRKSEYRELLNRNDSSKVIKHFKEKFSEFPETRIDINFFDKRVEEILKISLDYMILESSTGLVFFGFGEKDLYPKIINIEIYFKYSGKVYINDIEHGSCKSGSGKYPTSGILTYADSTCTDKILNGISWEMRDVIEGTYKIIEKYTKEFSKSKRLHQTLTELIEDDIIEKSVVKNHNRFIQNIEHFALEELAKMTRTLVELERLEKRMTSNIETVGGPIDVAAISKFDGFVWIERKHYFNPSLNSHFRSNYSENER